MMILPRKPSFGEDILQSLTSGFETYGKIRGTQKALQGLGFSKNEAKSIASLPESIQSQVLGSKLKQQQMASEGGLIAQAMGMDQQPMPQYQQQEQQYAPQMFDQPQARQQQTLTDQLNMLAQQKRQELASRLMQQPQQMFQPQLSPRMQALTMLGQIPSNQQLMQRIAEREVPRFEMPQQEVPQAPRDFPLRSQAMQQEQQPFITEAPRRQLSYAEQAKRIAALGASGAIDPQRARLLSDNLMAQAKIEQKQQSEAFKETKKEREEIIHKAQTARQNLQDLNRMDELEKEGKLDTPGYVEFLKRVGMDIPALMEPGSEEFQKIAQTFMRDAKTYLGSRISNFELEQFLKTIPSLSQSPEGRKRVIANLKRFNRVSLEYNKTRKEIMEENKGVPPLDLLEKIDDRIEGKLDAISEQFRRDLSRPVPKGQNKFITSLQAGAGSVVGFPGKLVKGVVSKFVGPSGDSED